MSQINYDFLFAFSAFKTDLVSKDQFIMVMSHWLSNKTQSLPSLMMKLSVLSKEERLLVEGLVQKQLDLHDGNYQNCLSELSSLGDVETQLIELGDLELAKQLQSLRSTKIFKDDQKGKVRFKKVKPHAKGAFGEVFVAEDTELKRSVALKEIQDKAANQEMVVARFVKEAEVTGQLEHPGIVPVYGLGFYDDGRPFYAMKFVKGDSLHEAIGQFHSSHESKKPLDQQNEALRKLIQRLVDVCNAVHYANSRGVLHRDLKPGNIMIGKYGETLIVDWGLARITGEIESVATSEDEISTSFDDSAKTQAGSLIGTPQFMSPEQAAGDLDSLNSTSDVYSLGATLFVLLTGQSPFPSGLSAKQFLSKVVQGDYRELKEVNSRIPEALAAIAIKAMSRNQSDRYQTAEELGEDLERWLADIPVKAYREPLLVRTQRWAREHQTLTTTAAVFLMTATIALIVGLYAVNEQKQIAQQNEKTATEALAGRDTAEAERRKAEQARRTAKQSETDALVALDKAVQQRKLSEQNLEQTSREKQLAEKAAAEAKLQANLAKKAQMQSDMARIEAEKQKQIAVMQEKKALREKSLALAAQKKAKEEQQKAVMALNAAEAERKKAETSLRIAKKSQEQAIRNNKIAEQNLSLAKNEETAAIERLKKELQLSNALRLSSVSNEIRSTKPLKSLLLAREACLATEVPIPEAETALRDALNSTGGYPLSGHNGAISFAVLTPDGKRLITGSADRTIRIWDLTAEDPARSPTILRGHNDYVRSAVVTPDGKRLITVSIDKTARIWDLTASDPSQSSIVLRGHSVGGQFGERSSLVVTPDGRRLIAVATSGYGLIWDLKDAAPDESVTELKIYTGSGKDNHNRRIIFPVLTPDGQRLIFGCRDGTTQIWNISAKVPTRSATLSGDSSSILAVALTPDGKRVVTGSESGTVVIFDLTANVPARSRIVLDGHQKGVWTIAVTPDGKRLITGSADRTVRIWDLTASDPSQSSTVLRGHAVGGGRFRERSSLVVTPDGRRLITIGDDNTPRIWDLTAEDPNQSSIKLRGHVNPVRFAVVTPDGKRLITMSNDRTVRIWDLNASDPSQSSIVLRGHSVGGERSSLVVTPDGRRLITIGDDITPRIWDLTAEDPSQSSIKVQGKFSLTGKLAAVTPDGKRLITAGYDKKVRIWELTAKDPSQFSAILKGDVGAGRLVFATPDGNRFFSTSDKTARIWDLTAEDPRQTSIELRGHLDQIRSVAVTPDGKRLITAGYDKQVRIWDLTAKDPSQFSTVLGRHKKEVQTIAVTSDGKRLITAGNDQKVIIWDLTAEDPSQSSIELGGHKKEVRTIAVTPDGKRLITASYDQKVRIWDLTAKDPSQFSTVLDDYYYGVRSVAVTPDGKWLITTGYDKSPRIWDLTAKDLSQSAINLWGHAGIVSSVVVTPDGKRLITGSSDKTARIWDLTAEDPETTAVVLKGLTISSSAELAITSDGKRLVSPGHGGTIRCWDIEVDPLIDYARTLAGRELTEEERVIYKVPERVNKRPYKRTIRTYGYRLPFVKE